MAVKRTSLIIGSSEGEHELVSPVKGRVTALLVDDLNRIRLVVEHVGDAVVHKRWFRVHADPCEVPEPERYLGPVAVGGAVLHVTEVPFKVVTDDALDGDE